MRKLIAIALCMVTTALASWQTPDASVREQAYRANNIGVALLEQFDYEGAARSFNDALKQHPALDIARLNLAIALFYAGKTSCSIEETCERSASSCQSRTSTPSIVIRPLSTS